MISISHLAKNYGDFHLNISMEIPAGTVSGIVGRNGAGKSTTIKSILGIVKPDSGVIKVMGKDVAHLTGADKALIGVAMSDSGFSSYLSVNDIIKVLKSMYSDFDEADFRAKCERNRLPFNKKIKEFSTGMNAKLRVLVACCHSSKLLILDEPTAGLDVIARAEVLDMLRDYLAEDPERTMLISSHISSDLEGICDDIYMLQNGEVILHEDTDAILGEYAVLKVSKAAYEKLDKQYILRVKEETFGYSCFTNQRRFYAENYPEIVIESGSIDDMIVLMTEGR